MAAIQKNILEHISLMANEQVQLEFREQLQQMQMMQQQAASNPQSCTSYKRYLTRGRSKKICVNCRDDTRIYDGREENYITI